MAKILMITICIALITVAVHGDIVTDWNQTGMSLGPSVGVQQASRIMAMMHTAMYDTLVAYDGGFNPYYFNSPAPAGSSRQAAVTAAAYHVLYNSYVTPTQQDLIQTRYNNHIAQIGSGPAVDAAITFGQTVAQAFMNMRSNDGSVEAMTTLHPDGDQPGQWRRTGPMEPVAPGWGNVTPWAMTAGNQFDQGGPPSLDSLEYTNAYNQTRLWGDKNSALRNTDQSNSALFWNEHVPRQWHSLARNISQRESLTLADNARLFALLSVSMADAAIAGWDMKYNHNFWRPVTAIRLGDDDNNDNTIGYPGWESFLSNPSFPEYVSGHSITSATAAKLLEYYFGQGNYDFDLTLMDNSMTRSYHSFWEAAEDAGLSRIYGGIHFDFSNVDGLNAGTELSSYVFNNFMTPIPEPLSLTLFMLGGLLAYQRRTLP